VEQLFQKDGTMEMQTTTTIAQQVRRYFVENYCLGDDSFMDGDSFFEKGIIDSTGILELVAFLQMTFGITVQDEELTADNLDSINNVAAYVYSKRNAGSALGIPSDTPQKIS
jgi:acyl carrier protein